MTADLDLVAPLALACLVVSAFCAGTEVALFSIRGVERSQLATATRWVDRRVAATLERPRRLIATMLIGSEVCNSLLAVLVFAVFRGSFAVWSALWLAIAVAGPAIILVSEITAKTLAAKSPLSWSRAAVLPLAGFAIAVTPVRILIQAVTAAVLRPFGLATRSRPARDLSEAEFRTLVDAGSAQGQVDARERRLIHRVFEFHDKNVGQVMTPRERIFALSYDLPAQRLVKELAARGFSRVPIFQRSLDNVRGILNAKDLVRTTAGQPLGRPLGELLHEPLFVPRTTPIKRLFLTFKQKKVHMAVVVSEYGKVLGLVTMDDLLAQIFGVLRDERAELQNTIPPGRGPRVPALVRPDADGTGPIPPAPEPRLPPRRASTSKLPPLHGSRPPDPTPTPPAHDAVSPPPGFDDRSGAVSQPDPSPGSALGVLDPPPRPVHDADEVTPPATDIADLVQRSTSGGERGGAS